MAIPVPYRLSGVLRRSARMPLSAALIGLLLGGCSINLGSHA
jgi:hypothetical protein